MTADPTALRELLASDIEHLAQFIRNFPGKFNNSHLEVKVFLLGDAVMRLLGVHLDELKERHAALTQDHQEAANG